MMNFGTNLLLCRLRTQEHGCRSLYSDRVATGCWWGPPISRKLVGEQRDHFGLEKEAHMTQKPSEAYLAGYFFGREGRRTERR
jgi:hypothetical protein